MFGTSNLVFCFENWRQGKTIFHDLVNFCDFQCWTIRNFLKLGRIKLEILIPYLVFEKSDKKYKVKKIKRKNMIKEKVKEKKK